MAKATLILMASFVLIFGTTFAQDSDEGTNPSLNNKHQFGARIGTWINTGDDIPESLVLLNDLDQVVGQLETNVSSVNAYFEAYFAYNLFPQTFIEFSLGIVNRGSVTVQDGPYTDIGNLILYPVLLQFKFYPLSSAHSRFQPYVAAGGGIYHGRQDIQFTTDDIFFANLNEESETDFNYVLSGGADWLLNDRFALDLNFKYMPIDFSESLITVNDYGAVAVTVGVKYLYGGKK